MIIIIKQSIWQKLTSTVLFKFTIVFFLAVLLSEIPSANVQASTGFKIYNYSSNKTTKYSDKQVQITYNGVKISKAETPGILVNGIALVPYEDVFQNSAIKAECFYNKDKNTVTISKYGITIVMTIGSKKAHVNGKLVTLSAAPMKIKYLNCNRVKVLVPSRFVSESLGLGYNWYSTKSIIEIRKDTLQLSYNGGKVFEYTGVRGKVTINGKAVDLGNMPSIIKENTAMLQAKKVFANTSINSVYTYNKTSKKITLKNGTNTLIMTIGSKKATLNNKSITLDSAPILVKNYNDNITYVMVPGRLTATSLGYNYSWNSTTKTSTITAKDNSKDNSTSVELGDNGVVNEKGSILNEWFGIDTLYGKDSEIYNLDSGIRSKDNKGNIYYVSRDYNRMKQNSETYMFTSTMPFEVVTSSSNGKLITITANNLSCTDQTYQVFGAMGNLLNTIHTANLQEQISTIIMLETITEDYRYDLSLSADGLILYVTVYTNALIHATIGVNSSGDYLSLEGLTPFKPSIVVQENLMFIDLAATTNGLGDISANLTGTKYIRQILTINNGNNTQVILQLNEGYLYYILESGNQYTISFQTNLNTSNPDTSGTDTTSPDIFNPNEDTSLPGNTSANSAIKEIPVVSNTSDYEIIIPRPAGISSNNISEEDYYYSKYFVIRLEGDHRNLINSNSITSRSSAVDNISVSINSKNETVIKITTKKIQGYEIAWDENNIYVNVGNPGDIYENIVLLDPGHGGSAVGALYYGTYEKDINFKILYTIGKKYFNQNTSKLKVYYTRTSDVNPGLSERAVFADQVDADLFISLHMNASLTSSYHGTEVYYSKKNNSTNRSGLTSQALATSLVKNLTGDLGTKNRGVKFEDYTVIYKSKIPAVLIELGFMSNQSEYNNLVNESFQEKAAKSIYETLLQVFEKYPGGK